jgi:hypothetical protein
MATFAVIESNKVTNVIVADTKEIAETITGLTCVEYTEENPAGIGWGYDGSTFDRPRSTFDHSLMEEPNE